MGAGLALVAAMALVAVPSEAHRSRCHQQHSCPSDHATYKWRGLYCVKPDSDKRESHHSQKVRHAGKTYYCGKRR